MMLRFRRPSLLAPLPVQDGRLHSPLATASFTLPLSRRYSTSIKDDTGDESENDKDKMWTDSPPSVDSGATTPSLNSDPSEKSSLKADSDISIKSTTPARSSSPPPRTPAKPPVELASESIAQMKLRRLSQPIKMPRILTLVSEAHPEEAEVKSEAQFQRFVASCSDLPLPPRTPRALSDRGRYPEEAETDEPEREDTPSDDDDDNVDPTESSTFAFGAHSEPINIVKPVTPAQSVNGDDFSVESPGAAMDIDMPPYGGSPSMNSWRYTPPPTSSAVRSNKRKFDDRYDPYPANKRRAVSPSVSLLRESQSSFFPRTPNSTRVPMPIPITIPSGINSGSSSPVVSSFNGGSLAGGRPMSIGSASAMSSPTLRAQIGLSSPILRPMIRARRDTDAASGREREVEGAGEAVNGLSLE